MESRAGSVVSLEVVIPVWNEEDVLSLLFARLQAVFTSEALAAHGVRSVHYLFVDDGSHDGSAQAIAKAIDGGLPATLYRFSRNFGHQNAVSAGLAYSSADLVAVIDADLQDPPEIILSMVDRWRDGHEVVYGLRRRRKENPLKVAAYWAFYRLVAALSDISIPLDGGDFCLMDRRVVLGIVALPERLRFPRGLRAWIGYRQTGVAYDRPERQAGRSKYTLSKLYRLATDGVASSSIRPLKVAQVFSFTYLVLMLVIGVVLVRRSLLPGHLQPPPLVMVGFLLIVSGNFVQAFCTYILGAYVGRTYLEVKGRPPYVLMEVIGRGQPAASPRTDA